MTDTKPSETIPSIPMRSPPLEPVQEPTPPTSPPIERHTSSSAMFSFLTTGVTKLSATLTKKAATATAAITPALKDVTTNLQRDFPKTLERIQKGIVDLPRELQREKEEFVREKREEGGGRPGTENTAPWVGFEAHEEEMKKRMLKLSKDRRNFLVSPPEETVFRFEMKVYNQMALAALKEDPNLEKMRFELVPRMVTETMFWRNYFYRISLTKQSVLNDEAVTGKDVFSNGESEDILFDADAGNEEPTFPTLPPPSQSIPKSSATELSTAADPPIVQPHEDEDGIENWEEELRKAVGEETQHEV